jgi:hypothetical protein
LACPGQTIGSGESAPAAEHAILELTFILFSILENRHALSIWKTSCELSVKFAPIRIVNFSHADCLILDEIGGQRLTIFD